MPQAGIVFDGVCLWVCVFVCGKSRKLLVGNQCNLVGICHIVNARSDWKLETFDLGSYFCTFSIQAIYFEWLDPATSISVWRHVFWISRSHFSFKDMGPGQGHSSEKAVTCNSKTTVQKLLASDRNICCDNAQSNSELLTLRHFYIFFSIQALSFECLKLAASFSVWGYVFRISRSPSSFKVMGLVSRWQLQTLAACRFDLPSDTV